MKTSELTGPALDWAVAKAGGGIDQDISIGGYITKAIVIDNGRPLSMTYGDTYAPSENWEQGGPIIEQEKITWSMVLNPEGSAERRWLAFSYRYGSSKAVAGPSMLVAAMRCFVASKLGDEIDIPEELR